MIVARRITILLLILCLVLSFSYAALEAEHDCAGEEHCPICKIIALLSAFLGAVFLPFLFCASIQREEERVVAERMDAERITPIDLKVKLLN